MNAETDELRLSLFCVLGKGRDKKYCSSFRKLLKLLSPCRLFLRFTFVPRPLFHAARATAYQVVHYTAELMQIDDTTWQLSTKAITISSYKHLR